jgi:hypothetical protein
VDECRSSPGAAAEHRLYTEKKPRSKNDKPLTVFLLDPSVAPAYRLVGSLRLGKGKRALDLDCP